MTSPSKAVKDPSYMLSLWIACWSSVSFCHRWTYNVPKNKWTHQDSSWTWHFHFSCHQCTVPWRYQVGAIHCFVFAKFLFSFFSWNVCMPLVNFSTTFWSWWWSSSIFQGVGLQKFNLLKPWYLLASHEITIEPLTISTWIGVNFLKGHL